MMINLRQLAMYYERCYYHFIFVAYEIYKFIFLIKKEVKEVTCGFARESLSKSALAAVKAGMMR